ncbi:MAG: hypothetical protein JXB50_02275 [Spirochaetes bacterium]|nr:hypothetical protein [Spirochaetota bacterium]
MTFWEFLKDKLLYPLTTTCLLFQSIFQSICEMFDDLQTDALTLSLEWFPYYSKNIPKHMVDRSITPFQDEDSDAIRNRVIYAYSFYKETKLWSGIKKILSHYITGEYTISFVNNIAFAYFIILTVILTIEEKELIYQILNKYKFAHVSVYLINTDNDNAFVVGDCFIGEIKI